MAETNIATAHEIYSNKVLEEISPQLAALRVFSLDLNDEAGEKGDTIKVPLVAADPAGQWDDETNNYIRSATQMKEVKVEINRETIAGFAITRKQLANFRPNWWESKAALNAESVAGAVLEDVFGLVTAENYGDTAKDKISMPLAGFDNTKIADIRAECRKKGLRPNRSVLVLNPDYYSAGLKGLSAEKLGSTEALKGGVLPGLFGFNAVVEAPTYAGPGFVCHPDAIAVASRIEPPASDKVFERYGLITDPTTGLTLAVVWATEIATGTTSMSVSCVYGCGVGNKQALIRLVA